MKRVMKRIKTIIACGIAAFALVVGGCVDAALAQTYTDRHYSEPLHTRPGKVNRAHSHYPHHTPGVHQRLPEVHVSVWYRTRYGRFIVNTNTHYGPSTLRYNYQQAGYYHGTHSNYHRHWYPAITYYRFETKPVWVDCSAADIICY